MFKREDGRRWPLTQYDNEGEMGRGKHAIKMNKRRKRENNGRLGRSDTRWMAGSLTFQPFGYLSQHRQSKRHRRWFQSLRRCYALQRYHTSPPPSLPPSLPPSSFLIPSQNINLTKKKKNNNINDNNDNNQVDSFDLIHFWLIRHLLLD